MAEVYAWLAANASLMILILAGLALAMSAAIVWLLLRLHAVEARYLMLTAGTSAGSLHSVLEEHIGHVRAAAQATESLQGDVQRMELAGRKHIQHLGFLRYNPFRETGGDQSFVLALADAEGNGAVVSSLHSRDVTRIYGKPLAGWQSAYPLTEEEQQAIDRAKRHA